jgi:hypothetical protein
MPGTSREPATLYRVVVRPTLIASLKRTMPRCRLAGCCLQSAPWSGAARGMTLIAKGTSSSSGSSRDGELTGCRALLPVALAALVCLQTADARGSAALLASRAGGAAMAQAFALGLSIDDAANTAAGSGVRRVGLVARRSAPGEGHRCRHAPCLARLPFIAAAGRG